MYYVVYIMAYIRARDILRVVNLDMKEVLRIEVKILRWSEYKKQEQVLLLS